MSRGSWLLAIGFWLPAGDARASPDSTSVDKVDSAAQRTTPPGAPGRWWVGVWGAGAQHSRFHTRLGVRHRDFYMAGIRLGRELPVSRHLAVDYFVDVVPVLVSTNNPVAYRTVTTTCGAFTCDVETVMETETARGFGITPIGLQLRGFPHGRVQPVLGLSLGAAWYNRAVPDPDEQQLNFMGDVAAGVQMRVGRTSSMVAGVRQHHTSNAETGRVNPGIDSRVLYLGVTRSLGGRSRP